MGTFERMERVSRFLRSPGIFPPGFTAHPANGLARRALVSVLARLPEGVFEKVVDETTFVFDSPRTRMSGCSVGGVKNLVLIFERGLKAHSEVGLGGLMVHEIAHGFLTNGHREGEADDLAVRWGFGGEIAARKREGSDSS